MESNEYEKLSKELSKYGHRYDSAIDRHLPIRNKNGSIRKQRRDQMQTQAYWKSQCSFRGLKTTGGTDELIARLMSRDATKDVECEQNLKRIQDLLDTELDRRTAEQEREVAKQHEIWWRKPETTFEEKLRRDCERALREQLVHDERLRKDCILLTPAPLEIEFAARRVGLACEYIELAAFGRTGWATYVGQEHAVKPKALAASRQAEVRKREAERRAKEAEQAKRQALMDEAMSMDDWDLTGVWDVRCEELATYMSERPADLTMIIYREDASDSSSNSFCADFNFAVIEGVMRIHQYPSAQSTHGETKIKDDPRLYYKWRGRETGEGEIQTRAEREDMTSILAFANHGTAFIGSFDCEYIDRVRITGQKRSHGRGQKKSSSDEWESLSEEAWEGEAHRRWR